MNKTDENAQMTSSATEKLLPIYNVQTEEKKVAFTMNCAWNADDIDSILKTLDDNNVKITFFMVGDWVDKFPEAVKKISDAGHEAFIRSAKSASHVPIQWNLDSVDYTEITEDEMWKRLENKLSGGSIILMHNGTKHTADSLDMLIKNIKSKGYDIVTVSNLIYKDSYYIDNNGTQHLKNNV